MKEEVLITIETGGNEALFFTSNRVVVARLVGTATSWGLAAALGGIFGTIAESKMRDKKLNELRKLSPESILTDNKKNFAIPYTEITEVELGKKLKITAGGWHVHKFGLLKSKERESYANTLRPVLGDKLVVS
jgi:hypothetical protein